MTAQRSRDAGFTSFVTEQRGMLLTSAYLMSGDAEQAEEVVQAALAHLYGVLPAEAWEGTQSDPRRAALAQVLYAKPGRPVLPWQHPAERFELVDRPLRMPLPPGILTDLAELSSNQRRAIVLECFVQLPTVQIAALMGLDARRVDALALEAREFLVTRDPARQVDSRLADQMARAVPSELRLSGVRGPTDDLAHGRLLARRRRLRTAAVAAALLVAVVVGVPRLGPLLRSPANQASEPVPSATSVSPGCDLKVVTCHVGVVRDWRAQMARVTSAYLDRDRSYFSGYSYSYNDLYDMDSFWAGEGGVLGLDMFRLNKGATEVYIQIATSRRYAIRCGQRTRHPCVSMIFMDGNRFTVTDTSDVSQGLEVQYSPQGDEVITVVARNTSRGKTLAITRGDLIELVQDKRLRLPKV